MITMSCHEKMEKNFLLFHLQITLLPNRFFGRNIWKTACHPLHLHEFVIEVQTRIMTQQCKFNVSFGRMIVKICNKSRLPYLHHKCLIGNP